MKNELKLGNYILIDGEISRVDMFTFQLNENVVKIEPILLIEEWLTRFGFIKDSEVEFHIHSNNNHIIYIYFEKLRNCYAMIYNGAQFCVVQYVHQLQNLYFALTGEELKIKSDE